MAAKQSRVREIVYLWLAIALTILFSACKILADLSPRFQVLVGYYAEWPITQWFANVLLLWLSALLWMAYGRWRAALAREGELESVAAMISAEVFLVVRPDRTIVTCSAGVKAMFGYEIGEVLQQKTEMLYFDRRVQRHKREVYESLERVGFHVGFATGRRKTGETFPLEIVTGEIKGRAGAIVFIRDVTERKRAEAEILKAREEVEDVNRQREKLLVELQANYEKLKTMEDMRDNLTHMIAHDLRSPLGTISLQLEVLKRFAGKKLDASEIGYLDQAVGLVWQIDEMIGSMLDISRLENHRMPINLQACDVEDIARQALDALGADAKQQNVVLEKPPEPVVALCDPDIIRRVITNLVGNAFKFAPQGTVRIRMQLGDDHLKVEVIDNGPGIGKEYHEKIFDKFFQAEGKKHSTGLGLTFCKLAVEAHGGKIGVESDVGKGCTIRFLIPSKAPAAAGRASAVPASAGVSAN